MAHADLELIRADLVAVADPVKAEQMAAYMKGHFVFLGVTAGDRRSATKELIKAARAMEPDDLVELATACWAEPEREFHYVGMDALRAGAVHLRASDLGAIRGFITKTPWWDTVDSLAVHTVGTMVTNHAELVDDMDDWIESDDIWIARTAILHQLLYRERTDVNRLFTYCEMRMDDTDFFMRKAIGWALRQYARTDPEAVASFVKQHEEDLSGLTKREALKHLG
jgi:3-methyladenine DNA glycosylase AlkD